MQSTEQQIRQFVEDNFLFGQRDGDLSDEDSFLDNGVVDSTGVLELVFFLEDNFHIKVKDEDLTQANLDSINKVVNFVERNQVSVGEAGPKSRQLSDIG